jgi:hypothetical protein
MGMKKMAETKRLHMIVPLSWVKKIDAWRRQQPDLPNFSEAVRRLSEMSLEKSKTTKAK